MTLLGGDLGYETFEGSIIHHLDTIFDLKNKNTLWSIGNHDKTSDDNFKKITRKNKYHKYIRDNTTFIIINSQDSLSSIIGKQKDFLLDVLHKVNSKNIIVLSHKLIFMDQHPVLDSKINQICNGGKGNCYYCHNTNNFQSEIYPELVKIKKSGKTLIWIGGDLGYKTSKFEYIDKNGIIFLGNGFWYKNRKNKVLLFSNKDSQIKYRFIPIDTLIKYQSNKFMDSLSRAD